MKCWVTRPGQPGESLCNILSEAGHQAWHWPTILISDIAVHPSQLSAIQPGDHLIFVSQPAVNYGFPALKAALGDDLYRYHFYAVGGSTARALRSAGVSEVVYPEHDQRSEGLLDLMRGMFSNGHSLKFVGSSKPIPERDASDKATQSTGQCWIFRAQSGRPLLGDTLSAWGCSVTYVPCYQRVCPSDMSGAQQLWADANFDCVITASQESLLNAEQLLGADDVALKKKPVIVVGARTYAWASERGFSRLFCCEKATNSAIMEAIGAVERAMS